LHLINAIIKFFICIFYAAKSDSCVSLHKVRFKQPMKLKTILIVLLCAFISLPVSYLLFKFIHNNTIKDEIELYGYNTELVRFYSGKECLRLTSAKKRQFLTFKYDKIAFDNDSMAIFFKDNHRGYLSLNTGREVIAPIYTHAWQFSENLALVTNEKNKIGVIDRNGKLKIAFKYNYNQNHFFYQESPLYSFFDGICFITDNDRIGIIDSMGTEKLEPVYEDIFIESNGYVSTLKNGKWGIFDSVFLKLLECEFDNITVLESGLLLDKDGQEYLMSLDGKESISSKIYSDCYPLQYVSSDSEFSDFNSESELDSYADAEVEERLCPGWTVVENRLGAGLLRNSDCKLIIPCLYLEIRAISDKLFRCELDYDKFIIRDQNGKFVHF
jgi:hypothetical protein